MIECRTRQFAVKDDRVETRKPWMAYEEIEVIRDVLKMVRPRKCLEWGCGYSTRYFSRLLSDKSTWLSIEHNKSWFDKMTKDVPESANTEIVCIPPNCFPWTDECSDGAYSDLKDYVDFPDAQKFDFILVDGRARVACLQRSYELSSDSGVVVLHDAQRGYYHKPFSLYEHQVMLEGYGAGHNKMWIGSRNLPVEKIFGAQRYAALWRSYGFVGKIHIGGKRIID